MWRCSHASAGVTGRVPDVLVDELVVDDRGSQQAPTRFGIFIPILILLLRFFTLLVFVLVIFVLVILGSDHAALAEYVAVLLAGDFFRHLKYDLDQSIHGQLLRPMKQQPGLAEVFDCALIPRAGVVYAIAKRHVQFQAAGARRPGRPLLSRMTAPDDGFWLDMLQALGAAHGGPVILVLGGAQQTNLIVVSVSAAPWPGELVGAWPQHKKVHDFLRHDGYFRT